MFQEQQWSAPYYCNYNLPITMPTYIKNLNPRHLVLIASILFLCSCAKHYMGATYSDPYGFFSGVLHGFAFPFALIAKIISSRAHIITTVRNKIETIQTEDKKIKKAGTKEITREGFEYELTVNFQLERDGNFATASKDRTSMFTNRDPFVITSATGKELMDWVNSGAPVKETPKAPFDPGSVS